MGAQPQGLVGMEFGEWMRLRAIPAMQRAASVHFHSGSKWFAPGKYRALKDALGWDARGWGAKPCYMVSMDSDSRHHMTDMWEYQRTKRPRHQGTMRDRRIVPEGQLGWIDIDVCQFVPSAPVVPDCIQQPIESFFGVLKRHVYAAYQDAHGRDWQAMYGEIVRAYLDYAPQLDIAAFWRHAKVALEVFAGDLSDTVEYRGHTIMCTHGDWVPRRVAG